MSELVYSILRYAPSLVSGEKINLACVFYYPETNYRDFFSITKWGRVAAFDDTISIPMLKILMADMQDEIGSVLTSPSFDLEKFCAQYQSELYFDKSVTLFDISPAQVSDEIEKIKKLYFQFEYEQSERPKPEDQKRFLGRILKAKGMNYQRNAQKTGSYNEPITYDYLIRDVAVVFFNLNLDKIDNKTLNRVKAWAWNCEHSNSKYKILILYDLEKKQREDAIPIINILRDSADGVINIHDGFSDVALLLESAK